MDELKMVEDMIEVVKKIYEFGVKYVLIIGGGKFKYEKVVDVLYDGKIVEVLESEMIDMFYIYGVGCIFFAVVIVELVKGVEVKEVIYVVKEFIIVVIKEFFLLN